MFLFWGKVSKRLSRMGECPDTASSQATWPALLNGSRQPESSEAHLCCLHCLIVWQFLFMLCHFQSSPPSIKWWRLSLLNQQRLKCASGRAAGCDRLPSGVTLRSQSWAEVSQHLWLYLHGRYARACTHIRTSTVYVSEFSPPLPPCSQVVSTQTTQSGRPQRAFEACYK